jgi:hypothetical protein
VIPLLTSDMGDRGEMLNVVWHSQSKLEVVRPGIGDTGSLAEREFEVETEVQTNGLDEVVWRF